MTYPWYETVNDDDNQLRQGDFIANCPILVPPSTLSEEELEISFQEIDSIILSQSCDLVNGKIEIVLVCPYYSLETFLNGLPQDQQSSKAKKKQIDQLRKGYLPGYHLLNQDTQIDILDDYQVVDFRNVYGINFSSLLSIAESSTNRVRLLPPYREHLSQAFARYFMRVGLPQDIVVEGY